MRPGLPSATQLLEALAQRVVPVMGRRIDLQQLFERLPRRLVLSAVVVGPTKRLEDGAFARFGGRGASVTYMAIGVPSLACAVMCAVPGA